MARKKTSGGVITIGILHLLMALMGLMLSLYMALYCIGLFAMRAGGIPQGAPVEAHMVNAMPSYITIMVAKGLLGLVLTLMLVVAGIGLLMHHKWARYMTIAYGAMSILYTLIFVIYHLAVVNPATRPAVEAEARRQMPDPANQQGFVIGAMYASPCTSVMFMIYPLVVLVVMLLPGIAQAFERPARRRDAWDEEEDDYDREEFEERPRRPVDDDARDRFRGRDRWDEER